MIFTMYSWIAFIIVLVGGINWGLVGLFNVNLVTAIFGFGFIGRVIFIIVGVAAGYLCYELFRAKRNRWFDVDEGNILDR